MKKPQYRFGIWDSELECLVKLKLTGKPLLLEYVKQAEKFIEKDLRGSKRFSVFDLNKIKKKGGN